MILYPFTKAQLRRIAKMDLPRFVRIYLHAVYDDLLADLDRYYTHGVPDPRGTDAWLADHFEALTGITGIGAAFLRSLAKCPLCDNGPTFRCPRCSIGRCPRCAVLHDGGSLCRLTREYAVTHCAMRDSTELDESDFYFGRKAMASTYVRRSQH